MGIGVLILVVTLPAVSVPGWGAQPAGGDDASAFGVPPIARLIVGNIGRFLVLKPELNITPEQRSKIAATVKSHRDEIRPVAKNVPEKRAALRETVLASPRNEESIRKAANDLAKAIGDSSVLASKVVAEVRTTLTSHQMERIRKFRMESDKAAWHGLTTWADRTYEEIAGSPSSCGIERNLFPAISPSHLGE
jgi:Spy/CpxP family protein refolding chaperone